MDKFSGTKDTFKIHVWYKLKWLMLFLQITMWFDHLILRMGVQCVSSWDEWVPESRVLKYVDSNLQKQKELQKANQWVIKFRTSTWHKTDLSKKSINECTYHFYIPVIFCYYCGSRNGLCNLWCMFVFLMRKVLM